MAENYKKQSDKVAAYYDHWQQGYNEVYGNFIQAFRPSDVDELMQYIAASAHIHDGLKILDAGCGVGGPAIWLASRFNIEIAGITISEVQVSQAQEHVRQSDLSDKVSITQGDYHELSRHYPAMYFDRVLFLESLGHAGDPARVIREAWTTLKPGGSIYIKDFYYKEPDDAYWSTRIRKTMENINRLYAYNCLNLTEIITALRRTGFEIDFIRKFAFKDDISVRQEFETRFGIDIFGGEPEFYPAEWLEIKCIRPQS
ncbi:MAG: hypothetical protein KatS3mg031_1993 [Chitinophagales bacterium]|nr:MAG: hypothetical protein KatS3mg031_1993 [Chitinophagales bacterium]